jgi:hypothetical protein
MVAKAERQAQPYDEKPHWLRLLNSVRPMGKELLFMNTGTDSLVYPRWSTTDTAADRKRSEQAYYGSDK